MQGFLLKCIEVAYGAWNSTLKIIIDLLILSPETISGGAPYQLVNTIYNALASIGYTILVLSYLIGVGKDVTDFRQLRRPEWIVMSLFRLIVAQAIMANGLTILRGIYSFVVSLVEQITGYTLQLQTINGLSEEVRTTILDLGFFEALGLLLFAVLFLIVMFVAAAFIIITVYMRFFRLFLLMSMAPLFLGTLGGGVLGRSGKSYLQNHLSICMEGVGLLIACLLYSAFLGGGLPHILTDTQGMGAVFEYILSASMQAIMLCSMIKLIDSLMQRMIQIS